MFLCLLVIYFHLYELFFCEKGTQAKGQTEQVYQLITENLPQI